MYPKKYAYEVDQEHRGGELSLSECPRMGERKNLQIPGGMPCGGGGHGKRSN